MKKIITIISFLLLLQFPFCTNAKSNVSGLILLQVENHGEAWYINPDNEQRYYLGRPNDAFNLMRELGLGINNKLLDQYLNSKFPNNLSGKILLRVEGNGEAYYIYPKDLKGYYLGRPSDAFEIMRKLGLGITNDNLYRIRPAKINDNQITENPIPTKEEYSVSDFMTSVGQLICSNTDGSKSMGSSFLYKWDDKPVLFTNLHVFQGSIDCILKIDQATDDLDRSGSYLIDKSTYSSWNTVTDFGLFYLSNNQKNAIGSNDNSANIENLNYELKNLPLCSSQLKQGSRVYIIGYPAYGHSTLDIPGVGSVDQYSRLVSDGIISGYSSQVRALNGDLLYYDYFVSNRIDSGNSGGVALSEENDNFCLLGVPTWLSIGNYETQGVVQNIHNILSKE